MGCLRTVRNTPEFTRSLNYSPDTRVHPGENEQWRDRVCQEPEEWLAVTGRPARPTSSEVCREQEKGEQDIAGQPKMSQDGVSLSGMMRCAVGYL